VNASGLYEYLRHTSSRILLDAKAQRRAIEKRKVVKPRMDSGATTIGGMSGELDNRFEM